MMETTNDYCQELACLTNLRYHVMEAITWRINCEFMKFQAIDAHIGQNALYMQVAILRTWHLVEKLTKQPHIGKIACYQ
jgi:hypothetical protein